MVDLVLRPSRSGPKDKPWALQLRDHGPAETDYHTLCYVGHDTAKRIIEAGGAFWLFGEPNWEEIDRIETLEAAEKKIKELQAEIERLKNL